MNWKNVDKIERSFILKTMRTKDDNKRIAIYDAAMGVVNEKGVDNASMSKIAKAAGVSSSTIYVYFENKAEMVNKLYLLAKQECSLAMFSELKDTMSIEEATKSWMRNLFEYLTENPEKLSFLEQFHTSPTITEETRKVALQYVAPIMDLYDLGVQRKEIKNIPLPLMIVFTFEPIMGLAKMHMHTGHAIAEEVLEMALGMSWTAITK